MGFKTLLDIKTKISRDLDIEAEEFIQPEELVEYINDGITKAEAHIINLGLRDKYFLKRAYISIVEAQEDYDLPTDIYANKILNIVYQNGADLYTLKPIDSKDMFENIQFLNKYTTTDFYRYLIRHDTPGEEKLQLVPKPKTSVTNGLTVWFFRDANQLSADTDVCDLPEIAVQFIYQYVRTRVYEKEKGQSWAVAKEELKEIEGLMVSTLQQQIADSQLTELEHDVSFYQEHS